MALDTPTKRRSVAGCRRHPGVTPNASKNAGWRAEAGRNYSGIAFTTTPVDEEPIECEFDFPCDCVVLSISPPTRGQVAVLPATRAKAVLTTSRSAVLPASKAKGRTE